MALYTTKHNAVMILGFKGLKAFLFGEAVTH